MLTLKSEQKRLRKKSERNRKLTLLRIKYQSIQRVSKSALNTMNPGNEIPRCCLWELSCVLGKICRVLTPEPADVTVFGNKVSAGAVQ